MHLRAEGRSWALLLQMASTQAKAAPPLLHLQSTGVCLLAGQKLLVHRLFSSPHLNLDDFMRHQREGGP